ncbi:hypothetical protein BD410DRAFT_731728 [Rickenella mellea]|uniref:Cupredoxin n=1 Tax=Rickenella mellea TaxID=50990 RepID=A0A4Y7PMS2_9AGAM|nr:hypothetical protein BD410DRAFT_731728 [Rickenella mellea]
MDHYVKVGGVDAQNNPVLRFDPSEIYADKGDRVIFTYHVKNHSVTQSSFDSPCSKRKDPWTLAPNGFDSGFMPVASESGTLPTFTITVTDDKPIWGYCRQLLSNSTHCHNDMVFGINPPKYGSTFEQFLKNAEHDFSQFSLLPPITTTTFTTVTEEYTPPPTSVNVVTVTETITVEEEIWTTTYASWPGSPAPTPNKYPMNHQIIVGGTDGFIFNPPNITAQPKDTVTFIYMQKNHSVTQSSFGTPCRKLQDTTYPPLWGFDSGFFPVAPGATYFPNFTIIINDTAPVWGYCRQQAANFSHCGVGMVFSINAPTYGDHTFQAFQQLAVHQNGTGIVDQFGNITVATSTTAKYGDPTPAPGSGSGSGYGSGYGGSGSGNGYAGSGSKAEIGAASSNNDSSDNVNKLLGYAPIILGLLGTAIVLLVAVLGVAVTVLIRGRGATRTMNPSYKPVPVAMPSSKVLDDGTHDYDMPRYADA